MGLQTGGSEGRSPPSHHLQLASHVTPGQLPVCELKFNWGIKRHLRKPFPPRERLTEFGYQSFLSTCFPLSPPHLLFFLLRPSPSWWLAGALRKSRGPRGCNSPPWPTAWPCFPGREPGAVRPCACGCCSPCRFPRPPRGRAPGPAQSWFENHPQGNPERALLSSWMLKVNACDLRATTSLAHRRSALDFLSLEKRTPLDWQQG